jgi:hypothetical protein
MSQNRQVADGIFPIDYNHYFNEMSLGLKWCCGIALQDGRPQGIVHFQKPEKPLNSTSCSLIFVGR